MKNLEVKLGAGMTVNNIDEKTQDKIVENISSFAYTASRNLTLPASPCWPTHPLTSK